jgi:drug/metabolite transporter (DMT)-like permease
VIVWGTLVALVSAFFFALGAVGQHQVAARSTSKTSFNPRLFLDLARSPMWWASSFGDLLGFVLQGVALSMAPVALVQPLLVASLLLAIPLSAAIERRKPQRAEVVGALICAAGLAAFLLATDPGEGSDKISGGDGLLLLAGAGPVVAVLLVVALRTRGLSRAVTLALSAAALFGVCSPLMSVSVNDLSHFFSWPILVVAVCGVAGFLLTQSAYNAGSLPAPLACITIGEPIIAVTIGVGILGEHLKAGLFEIVVILLSVAAVIIGVSMVARHAPDAKAAQREAEARAAVSQPA